ncbi:hypothetical protein GCM10022392_24210 [Mucilaginibacter panaciglaebae]|uniref:Uncharacterized protein n=1 Tax=Mucilaginibacter panaciglaebae TaxID=502331 RepID=A0ABP7WXA4_9SPHI
MVMFITTHMAITKVYYKTKTGVLHIVSEHISIFCCESRIYTLSDICRTACKKPTKSKGQADEDLPGFNMKSQQFDLPFFTSNQTYLTP